MNEQFLTDNEVDVIIASTRPLSFSEIQDAYIWGFGSSFLLNYNENVYAITAKHVIENQKADPHHIRISIPKCTLALPIENIFSKTFDNNGEEIEDFLLLKINHIQFMKESKQDLYSWDFKNWSYPTSQLPIGTEILVAGFPFIREDRYDYDNKQINEMLLIRTGNIHTSILGSGMYAIEAASSEYPSNGMSGSPVFCRKKDGYLYFIGLVTRGSEYSEILHFISSEVIYSALKSLEEN